MQLLNGDGIGEADIWGCKHLGFSELDKIMCNEMKRGDSSVSGKNDTAYEDSP